MHPRLPPDQERRSLGSRGSGYRRSASHAKKQRSKQKPLLPRRFYSHRSRPSQVFTPPRLLGATARLLARRGCDRRALLGEVGTLLAEDLQRKRLNRKPVYAAGAPLDAGPTDVNDSALEAAA